MEQRQRFFTISRNQYQLIFACIIVTLSAHAQIHTLPSEKVESTPITTFSEETAAWPTQRYDSELLQSSNLSTFETLNRVPGIETRGSLSKGSPAITFRGSTKANRSLLLYDGIPLNLADGIGAQELLIPREALGSIQILKGPSGVYYGAGAMSGGVNFQPEFYTRSRLRATAGSFGQKGAFAAASLINDERNQVQLTGFTESLDGDYPYFSPTSGQNGTRTRTDTHTQRGTFSGNHILSGYRLGYRILHAQEFGSVPGAIGSPDPTSAQKTGGIYAFKVSKAYGPRWDTKVYASNVQTQSHFLTEKTQVSYDSRASETVTGFVTSYNEGAELRLQLLGDYKESSLSTVAISNKREQQAEPGLLVSFPFADDAVMQAGVRYLASYGILTKALGVVRTYENKKFWVTYAEGFRAPSLSDKYAEYTTFHGNHDLKPEVSTQIEVGASQQSRKHDDSFLNHFNSEISVFSTSYDNLITTTSDFSTLTNKDFVRIFGGEAAASYPFDLWDIGLAYSHVNAKFNNLPLALTTEHKLQASLAHYFGPIVFELQSTSWINYYRTASNEDKSNWNTYDFKVRTIGLTDWIFSAGVYNMFDEPIEYMTGYPEPRKRFTASLERLF